MDMARIPLPADYSSFEKLAEAVGCSRGTAHRALYYCYADGTHFCGAELAVTMHHVTRGKVAAWDLRPDLWAKGMVPPKPAGVL